MSTLVRASVHAALGCALSLSGCVKNEPPRERSDGTSAAGEPAKPSPKRPRTKRTRQKAKAPVRFGPPTRADAGPLVPAEVAAPPLLAPDGGLLEQTETEPTTSSPWFRQQAEQLFRAIAADDPKIARSFFFPIEAYRVVKASKNPDRDYTRRLIALFERDIHDYHRRLGAEPERARFVELSVPEGGARWMKPGSEGNRIGYHRVLRSQLVYLDAKGARQKLEVTSLISWRGEWYLVHLNGFR